MFSFALALARIRQDEQVVFLIEFSLYEWHGPPCLENASQRVGCTGFSRRIFHDNADHLAATRPLELHRRMVRRKYTRDLILGVVSLNIWSQGHRPAEPRLGRDERVEDDKVEFRQFVRVVLRILYTPNMTLHFTTGARVNILTHIGSPFIASKWRIPQPTSVPTRETRACRGHMICQSSRTLHQTKMSILWNTSSVVLLLIS